MLLHDHQKMLILKHILISEHTVTVVRRQIVAVSTSAVPVGDELERLNGATAEGAQEVSQVATGGGAHTCQDERGIDGHMLSLHELAVPFHTLESRAGRSEQQERERFSRGEIEMDQRFWHVRLKS